MITSVSVVNRFGSVLELPLWDYENGYIVSEIEGLGPVKASLASSAYAIFDGERFHSARRGSRNVVLTIEPVLGHVKTVTDLRRELYPYFMPKSQIELRFVTESGMNVGIQGVVESFEPTIFTAEPEFQISVVCHEPDFYDLAPTVRTGTATTSYSSINTGFIGTEETGFTLAFAVPNGGSSTPAFRVGTAGAQATFAGPVVSSSAGAIEINTRPGLRGVYLGATSLLATYNNVWPVLVPGGSDVMQVLSSPSRVYTLTYTNRYGAL